MSTTSVFQWSSNDFYKNHWKSIWEWVLKCIPVNFQWLLSESLEVSLGVSTTVVFQWSLFVWFDSLCPSQQSFSYAGTGLPGLNQYYARINVFQWSSNGFYQIHFEVNLEVSTTSVFRWRSDDYYKNHWKSIWEWVLQVYSSEILMTFIRITGSQFDSEYYKCIPVKFQWLTQIHLTSIWEWFQWNSNDIRITGSQFGSGAVLDCIDFWSLPSSLLQVSMTSVFQWNSSGSQFRSEDYQCIPVKFQWKSI